MHIFIPSLLCHFKESLQCCPCFLHLSTLPPTSPGGPLLADGELVELVSKHSALRLGNNTIRNHLHGNAIKSFFLWITQPVLGDSGRKWSVQNSVWLDGLGTRDWSGGRAMGLCHPQCPTHPSPTLNTLHLTIVDDTLHSQYTLCHCTAFFFKYISKQWSF